MWLPWQQPRSQGVSSFHFLEGGRKRDPRNEVCLTEFSATDTNPKWPVIVAFLNFPDVVLDGKYLLRFQSETFLQRSVNAPKVSSFEKCSLAEVPPAVLKSPHRILKTGLKANQKGQLNEKSRKTVFISCDFLTTHVKRLKNSHWENPMLQCSWHWIYSVGTCKPYLFMRRKSNFIKSHTVTKRALVSAKGFPYFSYFTRLNGDKCCFPWLLDYLCLHTLVYSRISKTNWCPKGFAYFSNFTRLNDDKCCFSWLLNYLWLHTLVYSVISKTNLSQSFSEVSFSTLPLDEG